MEEIVAQKMVAAAKDSRERLGEFVGVRLEKSFSGASTSKDQAEITKQKKRPTWMKSLTGGSDAQRIGQPNDALKAAMTKFSSALRSKKGDPDQAFKLVAEVLFEYFPPPGTCPLSSSSIELLLTFLERWTNDVTSEQIVDDTEGVSRGSAETARAAGSVLECVTRSSSEALGSRKGPILASFAENAVMAVTTNVATLTDKLKSVRDMNEIHDVSKKLCDWYMYGIRFVGNCLLALSNLGSNDAVIAFEVMRCFATLESPLGGCAESLEQVEAALAVIRSNLAERRYTPRPEISQGAVALMIVSGLRAWEVAWGEGIPSLEDRGVDWITKMAFLKRDCLSSAGALASEDLELASILASDLQYVKGVTDAITYYESLGPIAVDIVLELLNGVAEFCWYIAEDSHESKAIDAATNLVAQVAGCFKDEHGTIAFVHVLTELARRGGRGVLRILRTSGVLTRLMQNSLQTSTSTKSLSTVRICHQIEEVMELLRIVGVASREDVAPECISLMHLFSALPYADMNHEAMQGFLSVLTGLFVSAGENAICQLALSKTMSLLAKLADSIATNIEAGTPGDDSVDVIVESIMIALSSFLSHPLSLEFALRVDHEVDSLPPLLNHRSTLPLAVHHIVAVTTSVDAEAVEYTMQSSDVPRSPGARLKHRSKIEKLLAKLNPVENEDTVSCDVNIRLTRRKYLFRSLLTAATEKTHLPSLVALLGGVRAVIGSEIFIWNENLADYVGLRDDLVYNTVMDIFARGYRIFQDEQSMTQFTEELLQTIAELTRRTDPQILLEFIGYDRLQSVLQSTGKDLPGSAFNKLLSIVLAEDAPSFDELLGITPSRRPLDGLKVRNAEAAKLMVSLAFESTDSATRKRLFMVLNEVVKSSSPNRAVCGRIGVIDDLIAGIQEVGEDKELVQVLAKLIGSMAEYYLTPKKFFEILEIIKNPKDPSVACGLLEALSTAIAPPSKPIPEFDLSGISSGLLASNALSNFPPTRGGYAITAWFRAEMLSSRVTIFCVHDDQGNLLELSLEEGQLFVTFKQQKAKDITSSTGDSFIQVPAPVAVSEWCHVIVSHSVSTMFSRSSDLEVFINKEKVASTSLRYPRFPSEAVVLAVGFSPNSVKSHPFRGQFGPVLVFSDVLKQEHASAFSYLGPSFDGEALPCDPTIQRNVNLKIVPEVCLSIIEARLADKVLLLYTPKAADAKACPDNSPAGASGGRFTGLARFMGGPNSTRLCVPLVARETLHAVGGVGVLFYLFDSIDSIAQIDNEPNVTYPALENCIKLLASVIAGDLFYQEQLKELLGIELTSALASQASPRHLTIGVTKAVILLIRAAVGNSDLSERIASRWIVDFYLWLPAEEEVQLAMYEFVLNCFRCRTDDPLTKIVVGAVRVNQAMDAAQVCKYGTVRRLLMTIAIERMLSFADSEVASKRRATRNIFDTLSGIIAGVGEDAAEDLLGVAEDLNWKKNGAVVQEIGNSGEEILSSIIVAFYTSKVNLRMRAMNLACSLCKLKSPGYGLSNESVSKVLVAVGEKLLNSGVDVNSHQFLLTVAFGEERLGMRADPFPKALPLLFFVISNDPDPASRATAVRAVVNEVEASEDNRNYILSFPIWPKWMGKIMELPKNELPDPHAVAAIQEATVSLVAVLVLHAFRKKSLQDFFEMLDGFLGCGTDEITSLALKTTLTVIDKELAPIVLRGQRLGQEYRKQCYLERFAGTVMCVEVFSVFDEGGSIKDKMLMYGAVQSAKLLGLWTQATLALDPGGRAVGAQLGAVKEAEDEHVFDLDQMAREGGFLRLTLKLLTKLVFTAEDDNEADKYQELMVAVLAPMGQAATPEVYLQYTCKALERCEVRAIESKTSADAARIARVRESISAKWREHHVLFPAKSRGHDSSSPGLKAAEILREETRWELSMVQKSDSLALQFEIAYREAAEALLTQAQETKIWAAEISEERSRDLKFRQDRDRQDRALDVSNLTTYWIARQQAHLVEDAIIAAELLSTPPRFNRFWRVDTHEDSCGRKWILRIDPRGTDHADADLSRIDQLCLQDGNKSNSLKDVTGRISDLDALVRVPAAALVSGGSAMPSEDEYDSSDSEGDEEGHNHVDIPKSSSDSKAETNKSTRNTGSNEHARASPNNHVSSLNDKAAVMRSPLAATISDDSFAQLGGVLASDQTTGANILLFRTACKLVRPLGEFKGELELRPRTLCFRPVIDENEANEVIPITEKEYELSLVQELHSMRHLLQPVAFELHFKDRDPAFFTMKDETDREAFLKVLELQLRRVGKNPKIYRKYKSRAVALRDATMKWKRRQMSNFQYLMILNRLSGRTTNDGAQYPIFPWVLRDYTSETLDLQNPATFRNLSKPMGCQPSEDETGLIGVSKREAQFRQRYATWDDPSGIPPFHYGSHYSSMGTVVHFLVRLEPFSTMFLQLQGGHFDYPDRMFRSVHGAWRSATTSTQNVTELVPELYYCPEFVRNRNNLPLGTTQDGEVIGDVILPPWAHGSPERFVRLHREALESDYVSTHLSSWIDLIFGCKQRGKAAVDACNVFYYLTYEGSVDLNSLDPEYRIGLLEQIAHYGQTPLQLFKKPHVTRDAQPEAKTRPERLLTMTFETEATDWLDPVAFICPVQDLVLTIGRSRTLAIHRLSVLPDVRGDCPFALEADVRFAGDSSAAGHKRGRGRRVGGAHVAPQTPEASLGGMFAVTSDGKTIISAGHWDGSIRCQSVMDPGRPRQVVKQHRKVVTCLVISVDNQTLVTGSRDATVMVWSLYRGTDSDKLIHEEPRHVLYGHAASIQFVAVNAEVGVVVSGSIQGSCIVHSLRDGKIVRLMEGRTMFTKATITSFGDLIMLSPSDKLLRTCTINDVEIARIKSPCKLTAMCLSSDGRLVINGDELGDVCVRMSWNLEVLVKYARAPAAIASLALTLDETAVLVGLKDGRVVTHLLERETLNQRARILGLKGPPAVYPS